LTDLAIIIVNWNTRALTLDALRSLYDDLSAHGPSQSVVWVVDNASSDGSVEAIRAEFPQTNLVISKENLGFAGGNNAALREIGFGDDRPSDDLPRAVYLLNSDTRTHPGATLTLFEALFSLPDAGIVGAQLEYEDGSFQHGAFAFPGLSQLWIELLPAPGRFYESQRNGRYPLEKYQQGMPFPVDHTLGATMMLRREAIHQTGLFDEQFHMYCEEIDWTWRIQRAGWQAYCVPSARVTHLSGQSTTQVRPRSIVNLWTSRLHLYDKYYPRWKLSLARRIIRMGMKRAIKQDASEPALIDAYRQVIELTKK
jgi:GT2 family glycosyltransferase